MGCRRCGCSMEFDEVGDRVCWCDSCCFQGGCQSSSWQYVPGRRVLKVYIKSQIDSSDESLGQIISELRVACERFGEVDKVSCRCPSRDNENAGVQARVQFACDTSAFAALQAFGDVPLSDGSHRTIKATYEKSGALLTTHSDALRIVSLHIWRLKSPGCLPLGGLTLNGLREACEQYGTVNRICCSEPKAPLRYVDALVEYATVDGACALVGIDGGASLTKDGYNCSWTRFSQAREITVVPGMSDRMWNFEAGRIRDAVRAIGSAALDTVRQQDPSVETDALARCVEIAVGERVSLATERLASLPAEQRPKKRRTLCAWVMRVATSLTSNQAFVADPLEILSLLLESDIGLARSHAEFAAGMLVDKRPSEVDMVSLRHRPLDLTRLRNVAWKENAKAMTPDQLVGWVTRQAFVTVTSSAEQVVEELLGSGMVVETQDGKNMSDLCLTYHVPERMPKIGEIEETSHQNDNATERLENVVQAFTSFDEFDLSESILRGIYSAGFEKPSWIQQWGIKPILEGRHTVLKASSGTGKTVAYCVGVLPRVETALKACQVLVLAPGRELCLQIRNVISALGQYSGINCHACIGGTSVREDINKLREGPHIVIGACGRVYDMISKRHLKVDGVMSVVIDEADDMLSRNSRYQVFDILQCLPPHVPICLCSSTLSGQTLACLEGRMPRSAKVMVPDNYLCQGEDMHYRLDVGREENKLATLRHLIDILPITQAIVFISSRRKVDFLADQFQKQDVPITTLHAELDQKERELVMREFRSGLCRILLTTDTLARGIDVPNVNCVINYGIPSPECYIHQVGRAGRFGSAALAITFVADGEEDAVSKIEQQFGVQLLELAKQYTP